MDVDLKRLQQKIVSARSIVVLTGAGISADSGIPTFRGEEGLWKNFRAEDLATPEAFAKDPKIVWEWYHWRQNLIATKRPNPAHEALITLEKKSPSFTLITQNVDGLHRDAGSQNLIELHGNIFRTRCTGCSRIGPNGGNEWTAPAGVVTPAGRGGNKSVCTSTGLPDATSLPQCSFCKALLRPDIVWFGEAIPTDLLQRSITACTLAEIMIVIGTSGVVQPAASFASLAKEAGGFVIEINKAPTSLTPDQLILGSAAEMVPKIVGVF